MKGFSECTRSCGGGKRFLLEVSLLIAFFEGGINELLLLKNALILTHEILYDNIKREFY